ncbi:MAG: ion transporter [Methanomicrobiales archaeon]|nr:ion transporter [Methanomicrobiales archaeon]
MDSDTSLKSRIFDIIDDTDHESKPDRLFDFLIIILVLVNVALIFLESYKAVYEQFREIASFIEIITVLVFTIEYILRIWTCTHYKNYRHPVKGRLRYAVTIYMIIDLVAILPFYVALFLPFHPQVVQFCRLCRIFRIFKLLRYYSTVDVIFSVLVKKKDYIFSIILILFTFLTCSTFVMYTVESEAQPDKFEDFDNALWWAVVTMTTVGYGDVYPVTVIGKMFTIVMLLLGIGIIALPTGIIASGFLDEMRFRSEHEGSKRIPSVADELRKIHDLKTDGVISTEEFLELKERILKQHEMECCPPPDTRE